MLSGCTIVRNGVKLNYPLEASIRTYYDLCDEVVVAYDPTSEDDTEGLVRDIAKRLPRVRPVPSPWNTGNHKDGSEITIQSNVAVDACRGDWILYVQADEAIHEGDHEALKRMLARPDLHGVLFDRHSFMGTLDQEIPEYFAPQLLRLFRRGEGCVVGDGMTCGLYQGVRPTVPPERLRMYNYSRMGDREEILLRARYRDRFHIDTEAKIDENLKNEFRQSVRRFDQSRHPAALRAFYGARTPVTLALLVGPGERENLIPFFWQFRGWPGDVVVFDDMVVDGGRSVLEFALREIMKLPPDRYTIRRAPLNGDFGAARNALQEAAKGPWTLTSAPDERWDPGVLANIVGLIAQLERDGKVVCGFPRANFIDGVLSNDIPDTQWTEAGLLEALPGTSWPPRNPDVQYRLIRKEDRWAGRIHEHPVSMDERPQDVVVLRDAWMTHNKSYRRQEKQDAFYRSLGQRRGMPANNLRESTLREIVASLPKKRLVVVETGTLRDENRGARFSDGWSTVCLAECLAERGSPESRLYSIDINPDYLATSKRVVPEPLHAWMKWVEGDAAKAIEELPEKKIDLLYLDSSDDPEQILAEFRAALPKLAAKAIVIVDDTGPYEAGPDGKGTRVLPEAEKLGWTIERRDNERCHMSILRPPARRLAKGRA